MDIYPKSKISEINENEKRKLNPIDTSGKLSANDLIKNYNKKNKSDSTGIKNTENEIAFKVQFATSEKELDLKTGKYKGLEDVSYYKMGNTLKYTAGNFGSYEEVVAYQDKVRSLGFKDAFAVAFNKGQRIELKVAVELLKQQKNP